MAKEEYRFQGDFDRVLGILENEIINGSISASLEDASDFSDGGAR